MNFENGDYVRCDYLTDEVISWAVDQMYFQAINEGGFDEECSESFLDFRRGSLCDILAYYKPDNDPVTIYFSGLPYGSWERDITLDVLKCYLEEHL